jgi:hypothetical protein
VPALAVRLERRMKRGSLPLVPKKDPEEER